MPSTPPVTLTLVKFECLTCSLAYRYILEMPPPTPEGPRICYRAVYSSTRAPFSPGFCRLDLAHATIFAASSGLPRNVVDCFGTHPSHSCISHRVSLTLTSSKTFDKITEHCGGTPALHCRLDHTLSGATTRRPGEGHPAVGWHCVFINHGVRSW